MTMQGEFVGRTEIQRFRITDMYGRIRESFGTYNEAKQRAEELSKEIAYLAIVDEWVIVPGKDDGEIAFYR